MIRNDNRNMTPALPGLKDHSYFILFALQILQLLSSSVEPSGIHLLLI